MSLVLKDRVKETTSTTGTGVLDLDGAQAGFEGFLSSVGDGNTCYYAVVDADNTAWEVGVGTVADSGTVMLSRDTVLESSNSDQAISLTSGEHTVFLTYPADKSVYRNTNDQIVTTASGIVFSDSSIQTTAASGYTAGTGISLVGNEFNIDSSVIQSGDNISALVNDTGYLTSYSETGTLQTVTDNGSTTSNAVTINENLTAETVFADLDGPIVLECKNITGSQIDAGTPVYVSGYFSGNGKSLISPAIANDSSTMPAIGVLGEDIADDTEGHSHIFGLTPQIDTSSFAVGDTLYVAPTGGLTNVRPTGVNELVQNMGRTLRSDASQGRVLLLGPGRSNDVPNSGDFNTLTVQGVDVGFGDVAGPSASGSTDNALARYDGTTGKLVQDSLVTVSDSGQIRSDMSDVPDVDGDWFIGEHDNAEGLKLGFKFQGNNHYWSSISSIGNNNNAGKRGRSLELDCDSRVDTVTNADKNSVFMVNVHNNQAALSNSNLFGVYNNEGETFVVTAQGVIKVLDQSANPGSPGAGKHYIWVSDGTADGFNGDLMLKTDDNSIWNLLKHGAGGASFLGMDGGAYPNTSTALYSVVVGGRENDAVAEASFVGGGRLNVVNTNNSAIVGGASNVISSGNAGFIGGGGGNICHALYGVINGGETNSVGTGSHGKIGGGKNNSTGTGSHSVIVGGNNNSVGNAQFTFIGGGLNNNIAATSYVTICGGTSNEVTQDYGTIVGGFNNRVDGLHGFIGGGEDNEVTATHSFVGGGSSNTAGDTYNVVTGGETNTNTSDWGFIGGGKLNTVQTGQYNTLCGGYQNISAGSYAIVCGGSNNDAADIWTFVGGGENNTATEDHAIVVGGKDNNNAGDTSTLVGGLANNIGAAANYSTIGGGHTNDISASTEYATVAGGLRNEVKAGQSTICGGADGEVNGTYGFIGGGNENTVNGTYGIIVGGNSNEIAAGDHNIILGGLNNDMTTTNDYNIIVGGEANAISGVQEHAFIGGGTLNSIDGRAGYVGGGQNNDIINAASYATIGGGANNKVTATYGVVVGGDTNTAGLQAFVGGGGTNQASGRYCFVGGGLNNATSTDFYSAIVGGNGNKIYNIKCFIGGGGQNVASGIESVVCGGDTNQATANNSTIAGGRLNGARANNAFIGGGENNNIVAGGDYSVICGGDQNTITTNPSDDCAILGGRENSIRLGLGVVIGGGGDNIASGSYSAVFGGLGNAAVDIRTFIGGGENNTTYADHSTIAGGELNSASGDGSFIGGGHSNITTGIDSCVPGGLSNQANQHYSTALGKEAVTRNKGEITQSAGAFSTAGDSQIRRLHLRRQTTDDSTNIMLTDDGLSDGAGSWNCAVKTLQSYEVVIIGHKDDDSEFAKYTFDGLIRRASGSNPVSLDNNKTVNYESDASWDCDIAVGSGGIKINVTGVAATNINWTAKVVLTESTVP